MHQKIVENRVPLTPPLAMSKTGKDAPLLAAQSFPAPPETHGLRSSGSGLAPAAASLMSHWTEHGASPSGQGSQPNLLRQMEASFGEDFSGIRIERGLPSRDVSHGVRAVSEPEKIAMDPATLDDCHGAGKAVLAEELAHVVQKRRGQVVPDSIDCGHVEPGSSGNRDRQNLEDEAQVAAGQAAHGQQARIASGAHAPVRQFSLWDKVKGAGSWIGNKMGGAYQAATGFADTAGGYIKKAEAGLDGFVDKYENMAASSASWLANKANGIPVVEQLAKAGAWGAKQYTQLQGGIVKGAGSLLGGVANMVVHPLDTLKGVGAMAEHLPMPMVGVPNPLKLAHGLYDVGFNGKNMHETMNHTLNPVQSAKDDGQFWKGVGSAFIEPYAQSVKQGKYSEALGRGIFDIGSLFIGAGEVGGAAKAGETASVASKAGRAASVVGKTEEVANVAGKVAKAEEAATLASDAGKAADVAKAGDASEAARGSEYVDLSSPERRTHILDGDATGGGHRPGTGTPGKTEFPANWSDDQIMHNISDVATDPKAIPGANNSDKLYTKSGKPIRNTYTSVRDGVEVKVVVEPATGEIITGHPTRIVDPATGNLVPAPNNPLTPTPMVPNAGHAPVAPPSTGPAAVAPPPTAAGGAGSCLDDNRWIVPSTQLLKNVEASKDSGEQK